MFFTNVVDMQQAIALPPIFPLRLMSNVPMAMISDGMTRGMMIDFNALRNSFPTKETYIASLFDHSSSLLVLKITPKTTPAITPPKVAMVNKFCLMKDCVPFFVGLKWLKFNFPFMFDLRMKMQQVFRQSNYNQIRFFGIEMELGIKRFDCQQPRTYFCGLNRTNM